MQPSTMRFRCAPPIPSRPVLPPRKHHAHPLSTHALPPTFLPHATPHATPRALVVPHSIRAHDYVVTYSIHVQSTYRNSLCGDRRILAAVKYGTRYSIHLLTYVSRRSSIYNTHTHDGHTHTCTVNKIHVSIIHLYDCKRMS
jgi:hypothetical protein